MIEVLSSQETIVSRENLEKVVIEILIEEILRQETIVILEIMIEEIINRETIVIPETLETQEVTTEEILLLENLKHLLEMHHEKPNTLRKTILDIKIKTTISSHLYLLKKPERLDFSGFLISSTVYFYYCVF